MDMAYAAPADPEGVADDAEQRIYDVARREDADEVAILRDLVDQAMVDLENIQNRDTAYTGLPSGFRDLDDLTSGLQPGNLIVIAARPGVGKSSLATNIARNVAIGATSRGAVLARDVALRDRHAPAVLGGARRVGSHPQQARRSGRLVPRGPGRRGPARRAAAHRRRRQREHRRHPREGPTHADGPQGLELIIVDYLQLMTSPLTRRPDNRQQEVAEISRSLKLLAKELARPGHRALAAQPQPGGAARTSGRSSRTFASRAPSSRTPTS